MYEINTKLVNVINVKIINIKIIKSEQFLIKK
jgi:hypothetical protein